MKAFLKNRKTWIVVFLLLALFFFFVAVPFMTKPDRYQRSIEALEEKQKTVLELTAVSTAASTAITLLPGDAATPIANKLADLSSYFLIVLCAIFLEKYLLTITASAAFHILFPVSCILLALWLISDKRFWIALAVKTACFGLALILVIPTSVCVSNMIEKTYGTTINAAIEDAKETVDGVEGSQSTADTEEATGISGLFSKVKDSVSKAATETVEKFKNVLNNMIEALAVMLVTSCLIPILVILFFVWMIKLITGISIQLPSSDTIKKANPLAQHKEIE